MFLPMNLMNYTRHLANMFTGRLGGEEPVECRIWLPISAAWIHVFVRAGAAAIQLNAQSRKPGSSAGLHTGVHCVSPLDGRRNCADRRGPSTNLLELYDKAAGACGAFGELCVRGVSCAGVIAGNTNGSAY